MGIWFRKIARSLNDTIRKRSDRMENPMFWKVRFKDQTKFRWIILFCSRHFELFYYYNIWVCRLRNHKSFFYHYLHLTHSVIFWDKIKKRSFMIVLPSVFWREFLAGTWMYWAAISGTLDEFSNFNFPVSHVIILGLVPVWYMYWSHCTCGLIICWITVELSIC